jgi:hypothetical protein
MAKGFFLPVPLYLQVDCNNDTNEKCGAACTQMVLHDVDSQRPLTAGEQDGLFGDINNPASGGDAWHNPPQGVKRVLNVEKPATRPPQRSTLSQNIQSIFTAVPVDWKTPYEFAIWGVDGPDPNPDPGLYRAISIDDQIKQIEAISRRMIRTIALAGVAPIVAVREDNAHWIVVNGFVVEEDYRDADPSQTGKIKAMIIRNPLGRYTYATESCGPLSDQEMQVITGHTCELNPYALDIVPYSTWVREYMFSDWAETFVVVSDYPKQLPDDSLVKISRLAPRTGDRAADSPMYNWLALSARSLSASSKESRLITPDEAVERAKGIIEEFNLSQFNPRITPGNTLPPYNVKRSDRIDGDYYLVPVGAEYKISALISISFTGEFGGATIWPINIHGDIGVPGDKPKEGQAAGTTVIRNASAGLNDHYIAPFERHPRFDEVTAGERSSLVGRMIRLPDSEVPLRITSVTQDQTTPYVWRPGPESFSPARPLLNLKITVDGRANAIPYSLPVDNYCLPSDDKGNILLPSANYLEIVADCIRQSAGAMVDEVLAVVNRRGTSVMIMYKSNQTITPIEDEMEAMRQIICQCLTTNTWPGLVDFRIQAFATNDFLTRHRGGGEPFGLGCIPRSGGGGADPAFQIGACS